MDDFSIPLMASETDLVLVKLANNGVADIVMNRPEKRNAWDPEMVAGLKRCFHFLAQEDAVRVAVISGAGAAFSAGGDLNWMREILTESAEQRRKGAARIADLLETIDNFPKPLIAKVDGPAMAGAVGILCAADYTVATSRSIFGLGEVRIGIIPAVISPYIVRKIGLNAARAYCLSGAPFKVEVAQKIGLVHCVTEPPELKVEIDRQVDEFLKACPSAISEAKRIFRLSVVDNKDIREETLDAIVRVWQAPEAKEGISAFLEKRRPSWATVQKLER